MKASTFIVVLFVIGEVRSECNLTIPMGPENWTIVHSGEMPFFCNQSSSPSDCPLPPPGDVEEWLQLGNPNATKLQLIYEFPEECFPYDSYNLTIVNLMSVTDPICAYAQDATLWIELKGIVFPWPLKGGFDWTNTSYSAGPPFTPTSGPTHSGTNLKLVLDVRDDAFRKFSYIVIGGINLRLGE